MYACAEQITAVTSDAVAVAQGDPKEMSDRANVRIYVKHALEKKLNVSQRDLALNLNMNLGEIN